MHSIWTISMTSRFFYFLFLSFFATLVACNKSHPPIISSYPEDDQIVLPLGEINFEFRVQSESPLKSITVFHFKNNELQVQDTVVYTSMNEFNLFYKKNFFDLALPGDQIVLKIVATNESGESSSLLKKIVFRLIENPIIENQFFYSHDNTIFNGYSFISFNSITVDTSNLNACDIQEWFSPDDTLFTPDVVIHQWTSPNGGLFAPIAGSFYDTDVDDLPVIFENSSFGNTTGILSEGDVVIFKSNAEKYYLLLLKDIYEGPLGGRYTFDVRY